MGRLGTMTEHKINSKYLKETMTLKIFKPKLFSTLYKYHICIVQDGNDYYQLGRLATLSDKLHETKQIENTVFVGIHYRDKYDRRKKYHPTGEQNESYMKFLVNEVIPTTEKLIPAFHMGKSRTLMGDSLAGTLALMTALKYPYTFGKVIMQSPYVDATVLNKVESAEKLDLIDIYHTIGTNETNVRMTDGNEQDFTTPNRELNKLLKLANCHYEYYELDSGEHTWKYWQQDLPRALLSMFSPS